MCATCPAYFIILRIAIDQLVLLAKLNVAGYDELDMRLEWRGDKECTENFCGKTSLVVDFWIETPCSDVETSTQKTDEAES
jgi:hypothetical protein